MKWLLNFLRKLFCCTKLDDDESKLLLKNNTVSTQSDIFSFHTVYPSVGSFSFTSSNN